MKRQYKIARCGLACCLCSKNKECGGCGEGCPDFSTCPNRLCSIEQNIEHCYECEEDCKKGLLQKIKPQGFNLFIKRYGIDELLDCLERNEQNGVLYHIDGINGDYDNFDDVEELIEFIKTGKR